jgi:serine/threonine protein kinase
MPLLVERHAELIPGYRLIERIGTGGFGEVWKGEAPGGMLKAVKIIHGSLSESLTDEARLTQELKSLHRVKTIRHPYILSLERFDIIDGRLIIVSELADCTLFDRFKECRRHGLPGIPREELLRYMEETAEALDLMNGQFNLQHLDIKPQNIFLLFNHAKVGDFGLVKDLEGMFATVTSGLTAVYAAPESFEGVVSRYCDQYNLAIVYQEMLTGKLPFNGTSGQHLMRQHLMGVPELSPLPPADRPVIGRSLGKKPESRFASCLEMVRALRQAAVSEAHAPQDRPNAEPAQAVTPTAKPGRAAAPPESEEQPTAFMRHGGRITPASVSPSVRPVENPSVARTDRRSTPEKPLTRLSDVRDYLPPPPPPERPETTGDGVLLPALVVGLGGLGREVLQEFRKGLRKRGPTETWPHIRLLNIDTDVDGHERATREPDSVLSPEEILVTSFHRVGHYLKRQHERAELERWLPLNQLSSVARGQTTAEGWRPLGRLAFLSSGSLLPLRLRQELEACADDKSLTDAGQRTGLGLRSTRPRVYVVTGLTGGTGSGMFLDVAAALRRELRQIGHPRAELVAFLLAPAISKQAEARGVANSFAALSELRHFAATGSGDAAPFDRCVVLPLPAKADAAASQELVSLAGDFLSRELTTPLGRAADEGRAQCLPTLERSGAGLLCQTFGAYWFSVPRRSLLRQVARHICDRVVRRWGVLDSKALAETITTWVNDQLTQAGLSKETLSDRLQEACASALGQAPKTWREALVGRWANGGPADLRKRPGMVGKAMEELEELLGPPERQPDLALTSPLTTALGEACRSMAEQANVLLAELALDALREPQLRLACVEEAVQEQLGRALGEAAQWHKRHSEERFEEAGALWQQIPKEIELLQAGGLFRGAAKARAADAIRALFSQYLNARWDSACSLAACRLFQDLQLNNLQKFRRAVDCCHERIAQFLKTFAEPVANPRVDLGLGRYLLPFGCQTLEEAVARILDSLSPEEESVLHDNVRQLIHATLKEHVHVCTAPVSILRDLREQIDREVGKVAEDSLGRAHAAAVYFERQAEHPDADADLAGAFDEAQPELKVGERALRREFSILAVPPGPEGERFRALVKHALPDVTMHSAASTDDIVFYREQFISNVEQLPQLGPAAREIYNGILTNAQFGPHSRIDIVW